jgi:hypothetical protein
VEHPSLGAQGIARAPTFGRSTLGLAAWEYPLPATPGGADAAQNKERSSVRRSVASVLVGFALLIFAAPAQASTRVAFVGPARSYTLDGVCASSISAQERSGHPGFLTLDDGGNVVKVEYQGSYDTVLSSSQGVLTFTTIGSTTVTQNPDGTCRRAIRPAQSSCGSPGR